MMRIKGLLIGVFAMSLVVVTSLSSAADADTILVNGKIVTVDDRFTIAQAVAVKGQRIVAVGRNDEVTGKMVGGHKVNRQTITREEALIAHARNNAYILFQEGNLGSIQKGKYADLLVLDRDYRTIPEDKIKDIKPLMTMVGGKIVYEAKGN